MRVKLKLRPGDRGTKKLLDTFGDKLICVRYRYDEATKKRYKTVELIVDEINWSPKTTPKNNTLLFIDWNEKELQEKVKQEGGKWSHTKKLWKLNYNTILKLGLESRIRNE